MVLHDTYHNIQAIKMTLCLSHFLDRVLSEMDNEFFFSLSGGVVTHPEISLQGCIQTCQISHFFYLLLIQYNCYIKNYYHN